MRNTCKYDISNPFIKSYVSLNNSSVSVGKPTITSTPIQQSGITDLMYCTLSEYNSLLIPASHIS